MRTDSEPRMPAISPQALYEAQEALSKNDIPYPQPTDVISERGVSYDIEDGKGFSGTLQKSQTNKQQRVRGRQRPSSTVWHLILVFGDVSLLVALFGSILFFHLIPQVSKDTLGIRDVKLLWICLALVSWGLAVNVTQSQNLSYASNRFKSPCCALFALVLMCIFWIVLSYLLLGVEFITLAWLELFFLALAIPVFTTWRFLLAQVMHLPRFRPRAVIVGVNSAGETVAKEIQSAKHSRTNILGYIGEGTGERSYQNALPILGGRSALRDLANNSMIDMIIIALEYGTNPELLKEAVEAAQFGIAVLPMTVVYENSTGKIPVEHVGDQWYVALQSEHMVSLFYLCWKKILDLVCGLGGLLVLCLLLPVIALCIYLDSPGPIFYSQERVGLREKPFRIYKFRSMYPDAEGGGRATWASEYDKRVTRVGRFLRATHLDELPQLFNILRGDMSLIGPRPERAAFVTELEKTIPFYRYRLAVKPGITGWAQVKYRYGRSGDDALIKLQYDLYYIKRQSFMLDLFIILKTVTEVLSLRGT
ncbi:MAG: sugar transferase [Chloroflexi bacterium]|nr:MAG: sugar transferase [Chloroflexota bacterium]